MEELDGEQSKTTTPSAPAPKVAPLKKAEPAASQSVFIPPPPQLKPQNEPAVKKQRAPIKTHVISKKKPEPETPLKPVMTKIEEEPPAPPQTNERKLQDLSANDILNVIEQKPLPQLNDTNFVLRYPPGDLKPVEKDSALVPQITTLSKKHQFGINIKSYAFTPGQPESENRKLSLDRATALRDHFTKSGIDEDRISIAHEGDNCGSLKNPGATCNTVVINLFR